MSEETLIAIILAQWIAMIWRARITNRRIKKLREALYEDQAARTG